MNIKYNMYLLKCIDDVSKIKFADVIYYIFHVLLQLYYGNMLIHYDLTVQNITACFNPCLLFQFLLLISNISEMNTLCNSSVSSLNNQ